MPRLLTSFQAAHKQWILGHFLWRFICMRLELDNGLFFLKINCSCPGSTEYHRNWAAAQGGWFLIQCQRLWLAVQLQDRDAEGQSSSDLNSVLSWFLSSDLVLLPSRSRSMATRFNEQRLRVGTAFLWSRSITASSCFPDTKKDRSCNYRAAQG